MKTIEVKGMSCEHCVKTISQAITRLDPDASVNVDLARGLVNIESRQLTEAAIKTAITDAGYSAGNWKML